MHTQHHSRQTIDISRLIRSDHQTAARVQNPLEFAPSAFLHEKLGLLVGQQLWSLPLPLETLDQTARASQADVLMFRDMKDRDPLRSVRCDLSVWIGECLLIVRDLIPHYGLNGIASFMNEQSPGFVLSPRGLVLAPHLPQIGFRERVEGIERATQLLLGQSRSKIVA